MEIGGPGNGSALLPLGRIWRRNLWVESSFKLCNSRIQKQCKDLLTWFIHGIMKSCLSTLEIVFPFPLSRWKWCTNMGKYCYVSSLCVWDWRRFFSPLLPDSTIVMNYSQKKNVEPENHQSTKFEWKIFFQDFIFWFPVFRGGWKSLGWKSSNIRFPA